MFFKAVYKKGTSMILCFYGQEVVTFKEKHKIIDVPFSSPRRPLFFAKLKRTHSEINKLSKVSPELKDVEIFKEKHKIIDVPFLA